MHMQPTIYTERLTLRPFLVEDGEDVRRLAGDRRIANTTLAIPHPYPVGAAEAWIATHVTGFNTGKEITFAVIRSDNSSLVGAVTLLDISAVHARAEVGYWIGAESWSNGYCTEAILHPRGSWKRRA